MLVVFSRLLGEIFGSKTFSVSRDFSSSVVFLHRIGSGLFLKDSSFFLGFVLGFPCLAILRFAHSSQVVCSPLSRGIVSVPFSSCFSPLGELFVLGFLLFELRKSFGSKLWEQICFSWVLFLKRFPWFRPLLLGSSERWFSFLIFTHNLLLEVSVRQFLAYCSSQKFLLIAVGRIFFFLPPSLLKVPFLVPIVPGS